MHSPFGEAMVSIASVRYVQTLRSDDRGGEGDRVVGFPEGVYTSGIVRWAHWKSSLEVKVRQRVHCLKKYLEIADKNVRGLQ